MAPARLSRKAVLRFRPVLVVMALAFVVGNAGNTHGQAPATSDDTKARLEQLEAEVKALKAAAEKSAVAKPPGEAGDKKPGDGEKKPETFVVGDDLKFLVTWDGGGFRFKTADEAFNIHFGGRLMSDQVWWNQSPNMRGPVNQPPGSPLRLVTGVGPGIGDLQDGFFIRRARIVADGAIYQTMEFKIEFDFENYNSIAFDESFIGQRDLPYIDTVRIGQMHVPFGLEAFTSSRYLPMLERSQLFDAFYQEFAPGIFSNTTFCDQRITTQHMFHRVDNFSQFNGASFGDGKYAYSGRVSALPVYEENGRCLLHMGLAYQWRKGSTPLDFNGGTTLPPLDPNIAKISDLVRFRARPAIRDAVGLQGDSARVIDTGNIIADNVNSLNAELMAYWGPAWFQSEACVARVTNAVFPAGPNSSNHGDPVFYGTYAQVGYLLTGENRGYDKRFGKYDRVRPLENFFLVKDENGCHQYGLGAWEVAYRFSYVNLNDELIQGGTYAEHTVGLNWYWNSNAKIQMNYINGQRLVPAGAVSGNVQGFGLRAALEF